MFGGVILGVILPPSILGSAVARGAVGAATGVAWELHHRGELADQLDGTIAPGHSGIIASVVDPRAVEIRNAPGRARGAGRPHQVRGRVLGQLAGRPDRVRRVATDSGAIAHAEFDALKARALV